MKKPLIIIALLALILPGALLAQDDLTLSGLAQQLAALTDKVTTTNTDISMLTAATGKIGQTHPGTARPHKRSRAMVPSLQPTPAKIKSRPRT